MKYFGVYSVVYIDDAENYVTDVRYINADKIISIEEVKKGDLYSKKFEHGARILVEGVEEYFYSPLRPMQIISKLGEVL